MGYRNLVNKYVGIAYDIVDDLLEDLQFEKVNVTGFNFNSHLPNIAGSSTVTLRALLIKQGRVKDNPQMLQIEFLFKGNVVKDVSIYDSFTWLGNKWNVAPPVLFDGYNTTINATREV